MIRRLREWFGTPNKRVGAAAAAPPGFVVEARLERARDGLKENPGCFFSLFDSAMQSTRPDDYAAISVESRPRCGGREPLKPYSRAGSVVCLRLRLECL